MDSDGARWLLRGDLGTGRFYEGSIELGRCLDILGLFEGADRVTLVGCRPGPRLQAAVGAISPHRRYIRAEVHLVADDGSVHRLIEGEVRGTIESAEGDDLVDITVHCGEHEPLPGLREVLEVWRAGRPTEKNRWVGYSRRHWAGVALAHVSDTPDKPAGATYDLDGRHVTDLEAFYCALGEAVNGPGGYFGWNLDALVDCLRGGWGAQAPFTLVWHDAAVARNNFDTGEVLSILADADVTVLLR